MKVHTLSTRLQQMLQLDKAPLLRTRADQSAHRAASASSLPGVPLDETLSVGAVHEEMHDPGDGFLHINLELR